MTLCLVLSGGFSFAPAGIELYEKYPEVRQACAEVGEWTGTSFPALLEEDFTTRPERRSEAQFRQIALSFGVADVLFRMGVRPRAVGGVSLGEMIGAALTGSISRRELCEILLYSDKNVPDAPPDGRELAFGGLMLPAGEDEQFYVGDHRPDIHVGANNFGTLADGSRVLMISGYREDLAALAEEVEKTPDRPGTVQVYPGWGALHCPLNQYIKDVMAPYLATVDFRDPQLPLFSGRVPGRVDAAGVRADFAENYTSYVSVTFLHSELTKFGARLGITLASGTAPEMNRYPFPVVQVQTPDDLEDAMSTMYELGVDFR